MPVLGGLGKAPDGEKKNKGKKKTKGENLKWED